MDSRPKPEALLNRVQIVNPSGPSDKGSAFKCEICDASFKSYDILLDHKNSKVHLKKAGIEKSALLKTASAGSIKSKLELLKKKQEISKLPSVRPEEVLKSRLEQAKLMIEKEKKEKYEKKKFSRKRKRENEKEGGQHYY